MRNTCWFCRRSSQECGGLWNGSKGQHVWYICSACAREALAALKSETATVLPFPTRNRHRGITLSPLLWVVTEPEPTA